MTANEESSCRCPFVRFGTNTSTSRNWSPDCPTHGTGTQWYRDNMENRVRNHDLRMGRVIDDKIDPG